MIEHYLLLPPYEVPRPAIPGAADRVPGGLRLLRPNSRASIVGAIAAACELQRQQPYLTLGMWLDRVPRASLPEFAIRAGEVGIRGLMVEDPPDNADLRARITDTSHLAHDLTYRLGVFGFRINASITQFLGVICRDLKPHRLEDLIARHDIRAAALRSSCERAGLGALASLFQILRLTLIAVQLQRTPQTRLSSAAERFGYWDDAALRNRFREVFGVSPSVVRAWIGWEHLLYVALRRRVPPPRGPVTSVAKGAATLPVALVADTPTWSSEMVL